MTETPLAFRVPAPPTPFVGREASLTQLKALTATWPVVVVTGPPGSGKSSLVAALVHGETPQLPARCVDGSLAGGVAALWKRLAAAIGATAPTPEAIVDQAEQSSLVIIIDGLDGDEAARDTLLDTLVRHGARGRWVVTARVVAPDGGATGRLPLGPLATPALAALAQTLGVPPAREHAVVEGAVGSPARLRRLAAGGTQTAFPDPWRELLSWLLASPEPLPPELFDSGDLATTVADARAWGVVRRNTQGVGLAPMTRADVLDAYGPPTIESRTALRDALQRCDTPAAHCEAARQCVMLGDVAGLVTLLDAHGQQLIEHRVVTTLWEALRETTAPELSRWRFRVAVAVGAVEAIDPPNDADLDLEVGYAKARLILLRGRSESGGAAAREVMERALAQGEDRLAFRAMMVVGAAHMNAARYVEAIALVAQVPPPTEADAVAALAFRAKALSYLEREDEARAVLQEAHARALKLSESLPPLVSSRLAASCLELDQRAMARVLLPDLSDPDAVDLGRNLTWTLNLTHAALIALDDGRLSDVGNLADQIAATRLESSVARDHLQLIQTEWLTAVGQFRAAAEVREALSERILVPGNASWIAGLADAAGMALGQAPPASASKFDVDDSGASDVWDIQRARWALRHGAGPFETLPRSTRLKRRTRRAWPLLLRAEHALLHGDLDDAVYDAARATAAADQHGYGAFRCEALMTEVDALCVAGAWEEAREHAAQLAAHGARCGSPRFEQEARLLAAAVGPDWTALMQLAAGSEPAPVAARRAAALLGMEASMDVLDRRVVDAIRAGVGWPTVRVFGPTGVVPTWGIDVAHGRCWTSRGPVAMGTDSVRWRILACLAARGGHADNATLLKEVWDVATYKPHLHDNRLQIAIHKLRKSLADAGAGAPLERVDEGYGLSGPCVVARP